jgi:hypothetical protein
MDVQTGDTEFRPDPAATAVVPATGAGGSAGQGVLFQDTHGYSAFGDTDKIPAVAGARGGRGGRGRGGDRDRRPGAPRWLRLAVTLVVVAILGAAAALGLVKAGVIGGNSKNPGQSTSATTHPTTPHTTNPVETNTLLTAAGTTSSGAASYTIHQHAFGVTVTTSVGRSWVQIGVVGQRPVFAGIVPPNSSQKEILLGTAQVQVGAGGTKVIISSGKKSQTLTPPSAPFSYQITPA